MSRLTFIPILFAGLIISCADNKTAAAHPKVVEDQLAVPQDRWIDDVSRYLAGLPAKPGSKIADLHDSPAFKAHMADFDAKWAVFEQERREKMENFQKTELSGSEITDSTLLYAFGGPDVLTAHTFFPKNKTYVLMGLEPPGGLPTEEYLRLKVQEKSDYLPKIRGSMKDILNKSFFITLLMDQMYRGQITDGLMPIMLVQMARTGYSVTGHLPVQLKDDGKWEARTPNSKATKGMIIDFQTDAGFKKRLIYVSANLQDDKLTANQPVLAFLALQKPTVAYFKAASYLPHHNDFKLIRDTILRLSLAILEDDSGIPFKYFDKDQWEFQFYGKYDRPYAGFKNMTQPTLKEAFSGPDVKPLDFPIGYGFKRIPSDLILAKKKTGAVASAAPVPTPKP